jgi:serine protease AprX
MKPSFVVASLALLAAGCQDSQPIAPTARPAASEPEQQIVIVNFNPAKTTTSALSSQIMNLGAGVIQFNNFSMVAALATPAQIDAMSGLAGATGVYANKQLTWMLAEGVPSIRADAVHAAGITGKGVGIAILDSGIDGVYSRDVVYPTKTVQNVKFIANLRDLFTFSGSINSTIKKGAQLFVEDQPNSETSVGHGTHVAGITAGTGAESNGKYKGVAPGAKLIGLGTGDILFVFWALAGFDYILDHQRDYNIQVVNNSWGTTGAFNPDDPINEATKEVHDRGIVVVFSAGNCGQGDPTGIDCPTPDQSQLNPYSVAPWTIGVAAGCKLVTPDPTNSRSQCNDGRDRVLADFSSRGLATNNALHEPDITAPGVLIVSVRASTGAVLTGIDINRDLRVCAISDAHKPFYTCASGTSMSAPHITGIIALMEEASGGTLTPDQALAVLKQTARPLPGYAPWEVGAGYADAFAAVQAVRKR